MKTLVLTGGIACGKSLCGSFFKELGCVFFDSDKIVRALYRKKSVQKTLSKNFGQKVIKKNCVDRKALAKIVFSGKKKLKKLNSLVHPLVFAELEKILSRYRKTKKIVVLEIPLFGKKNKINSDFVVTLYCPKKLQLKRLEKKGFPENEALVRINALPSRKPKTGFVIYSTGSKESIKRQVKKVFEEIQKSLKQEKALKRLYGNSSRRKDFGVGTFDREDAYK